jgi:hypothetical protein
MKVNHCGLLYSAWPACFPLMRLSRVKLSPADLPNLANPIITVIYPEILADQMIHLTLS